jgi:hypothetical protein
MRPTALTDTSSVPVTVSCDDVNGPLWYNGAQPVFNVARVVALPAVANGVFDVKFVPAKVGPV